MASEEQKKHGAAQRKKVEAAYHRLGGNITQIAKALNMAPPTVRHHLRRSGVTKPLASGSLTGVQEQPWKRPAKGKVLRYLCTSAQNNTHVNESVWKNLRALETFYGARLMVGTYSYNKNAYGRKATKLGTIKPGDMDKDLWYAPEIEPYLCDKRIALGEGLVWSGEMNIMPTDPNPLGTLETYNGGKSSIFPHAKMSMRSVAKAKDGKGTKLNYTTGTVTMLNYIQKKAGLKGEFHHVFGAVIVEVDHNGHWWVRQLNSDSEGTIYDLDIQVKNGQISTGHSLEGIVWGDFHATIIDNQVLLAAINKGEMIDTLRPKYQVIEDMIEGASVNHHAIKNPHEQFRTYLRGYANVTAELKATAEILNQYDRPYTTILIVDSNHDKWLERWLREHDYRRDPTNALMFLRLQLATYEAIEKHNIRFHVMEAAMKPFIGSPRVRFLREDESFYLCGNIQVGMHGHLGPNGARGTPNNLRCIGKAVTAHTHSAGIYDGLYVAGTSSQLNMGYNVGPSSWSHSHVLIYKNGKRAIVTVYNGKWRA